MDARLFRGKRSKARGTGHLKGMAIELNRTRRFRLDSELYARLEQAAESNHLTLSEAARLRLAELEIQPRRRALADE